jgi:putative ABC transport system substrate-binding protein
MRKQAMRRREFMTLLGVAAVWPLAARAQFDGRMRRIGALIGGDEGDEEKQSYIAAFRQALQRLGWHEGRNLRIDWRWAMGDISRAREQAAELLALRPDVLFSDNSFSVLELQRATAALPIVFAAATDPVATGFVTNLARPDRNLTGFADREPSSVGKLAEFVRELSPQVTRVGIVGNTFTGNTVSQTVERAAVLLGLQPTLISAPDAQALEAGIAAFAQMPAGALVIPSDPITVIHRKLVVALAQRYRLPAVYGFRFYVADGGLLSYGVDKRDQYSGAARYIDRVLKGAKPADLPVQLPVKYELVVNGKAVKALGLELPLSILMRIDEVIE